MDNKAETVEIDIIKLAKAVLKRIWIVIIAAVIGGGAVFGATYAFVDPTYKASALIYVNNSNVTVGGLDMSISSSSLTAAQELVNTYIVILKTRTSLNEVIEYAGVDMNYRQLSGMITAAPVNSTEIFEIVVTSTKPDEAEIIANAIAQVLPGRISEIVEGSSVKIVDYAITPEARSGPSYSKNAVIGMLIGIIISVGIIVIRELHDVFIRSEEYLSSTYGIPVLALIPDSHSYNSYGYRSSDKSKLTEGEVSK